MSRRFLVLFLACGLFGLQAAFLLEGLAGLTLPPVPAAWIVVLGWPLAGAWLTLRKGWLPLPAHPRWPWWLGIAAVLFAVWALGYFAIGAWVPPHRVLQLSTRLEDALPFVPEASLLYLCVDPLFFLPFVLLSNEDALRRLSWAAFGAMVVSFLVWSAWPVAFPRPEVPPEVPGFGAWVLRLIQGNDPPVNCLPSTHCAMALLAALGTWRAHRALGAWALFTAGFIGISTVLTRQHYVVDVISGYALGGLAYVIAFRWRTRATSRGVK